ncbi:MAG TPA: SpoIID/LytB domain-containing protein [Nitriliruptorales bacterium]|nr:SpoIID/LytB domain-containing protein [Nitriliruptorales bacterium]
MRDPRRRRRRAALVCAAVGGLAISATALPASAQAPVDLGAYAGPIRFEAPPGVTFDVSGDLDGRYGETLEVRLDPDGDLMLVNDVSMRGYVEGIAEVPARWPEEALKAQAVAARTYAWYVARSNDYPGYDICATVACQVFRGRGPVEEPSGTRWAAAVAATDGEVLTRGGGPILARYFSTSGGHTRDNEDVFVAEQPLPYLRGVADPEDAVSPLHHWEVTFTRAELDAIVERIDQLAAASPVADVMFVPGGSGRPDRVRLVAVEGPRVEVTASRFRSTVSEVAPELFPQRFPSQRPDGRPMPMTLPSSRLAFTVTDREVRVDGRGFGHGVGMSQYGAKGKADAGQLYPDILAAYYGGLRPQRADGVPARVRVGLADASQFSLRADAPVRVLAGDRLLTERGLGTWTVQRRPDRTVQLIGPPGYGAPLVVTATTTDDPEPVEIRVVTLETVVNKTSELVLVVRDAAGRELLRRAVAIVAPGRHRTSWDLDGPDGTQLPPGPYDVALQAVDEHGTAGGDPVRLDVRPVTPSGRAPSLLGGTPTSPWPLPRLPAAAGAGAILGAAATLPRRRE